MGLSNYWNCARLLVGLLRTRLGRLVVLGSGGECIFYALACGHGITPFGHRVGEKGYVKKLDHFPRHHCLCHEPAWYLSGPLSATSVHAFASDPSRGVFILLLLVVTTGTALALFAWRGPTLKGSGFFQPISREGGLLLNNFLLTVAAASILLGTLYPLFLDVLDLGKVSVGAPYFNSVFVPLMTPMILVMGVAPFLHWKRGDAALVFPKLKDRSHRHRRRRSRDFCDY